MPRFLRRLPFQTSRCPLAQARTFGANSAVASVMMVAGLAAGCGEAATVGEAEAIEERTSAVVGPGAFCGDASAGACWDFWSNYMNFDINDGAECGALPDSMATENYTWKVVTCWFARGAGKTPGPSLFLNWSDPKNAIPGGNVSSIAVVSPRRTSTTIFVLSEDNRIRAITGDQSQPFYSGTNFKTSIEYMSAVDTGGSSLCLSQIAWITLPSMFAPNGELIARSCSGKVYVRTSRNNVAIWTPAASAGAPWNQLPAAQTWREISHGAQGAYLLSSTGRVLAIGQGTADSTGGVTYFAPKWLNLLTLPAGLTVKHVGGKYILVGSASEVCGTTSCPRDSTRVMAWTGGLYSTVPTSGAPNAPNDGVVPWNGIVDGSSFSTTPGAGYGLSHGFHRVYSLRP